MISNNAINAWFLFFCALWSAWAHRADAQELKSIRISLSLGSAQLPLWAARDAGLFAKHGLNAELLGLQVASRQVQLLLAGDTLAASLSGTTPIRARIEGADITIMMGLLNSFTLSVISVPEIKKPGDLKGRFIGVGALGGSPTLLTQRLLKKWGLETDVKFLAPAVISKAWPHWKNGGFTLPFSTRPVPTSLRINSALSNWQIWARNSNIPRRLSLLAKASYERSARLLLSSPRR